MAVLNLLLRLVQLRESAPPTSISKNAAKGPSKTGFCNLGPFLTSSKKDNIVKSGAVFWWPNELKREKLQAR